MVDFVLLCIGLGLTALWDLAWWGFAIYLLIRRIHFSRRALRVEGRVVRVDISRAGESGGGVTIYHPVVSFFDEHGNSHSVRSQKGDAMWDDLVDTPLDVLMLPGKPETAKVELDKNNTLKVVTILAIAFALPVGLFLLGVLTTYPVATVD